MIYTFIPYDPEKNLGSSYNRCMDMLPNDDDWAVFIDHDAMFTTNFWYHQISEVVKSHPNAGLITCVTNRIYNPKQIIFNRYELKGESATDLLNNHDIEFHRQLGHSLYELNGSSVEALNSDLLISGVVMVVKKKTWNSIKFCDGFLRVDNNFHQECSNRNLEVLLMTGLYVYHWYRADRENVIIPLIRD